MRLARLGRVSFSDPQYEHEGLRFMTIKSAALGARGDACLFVPLGIEDITALPLVLLLHGVYGSHWNWPLLGGAHRTAQRMIEGGEIAPVILVMPSDGLWGDGSSYVPHLQADYEAWIVEDVLGGVREPAAWPNAEPPSGPVYISGLSMGGYGALRLGAKHAQHFQGISGHSSVTQFEQMEQVLQRDGADYDIDATKDGSILYWMVRNRDRLPPLRFDCGVEDGLIEGNRELHRALEREDIPHIYEEFEGGHTWSYWGLHLTDTLRFFDSLGPEESK